MQQSIFVLTVIRPSQLGITSTVSSRGLLFGGSADLVVDHLNSHYGVRDFRCQVPNCNKSFGTCHVRCHHNESAEARKREPHKQSVVPSRCFIMTKEGIDAPEQTIIVRTNRHCMEN